jgi:hypothetical protein
VWGQVLLRKGQRLLRLALPYQLNQPLLLQVEEQRLLLLKDLRAAMHNIRRQCAADTTSVQ